MVMPIPCGRKKTGWSSIGFKSVSVHNARADVFVFVEEPVDFAMLMPWAWCEKTTGKVSEFPNNIPA
ncbi:unnamed protein product [Prunus armeniaca]|uniref:Uncharacterized protein n=1 Tax=Prunus armeniaca TaxID=36596 RepID=A0A6J5UU71_PRUAR|nr:unnamed protein product [Prunus armeniaca]